MWKSRWKHFRGVHFSSGLIFVDFAGFFSQIREKVAFMKFVLFFFLQTKIHAKFFF